MGRKVTTEQSCCRGKRRKKTKTQAEKLCGLQLPKQANPEYVLKNCILLSDPSSKLNFVWAGSSIPAEHHLRSNSRCSSQG